MKFEYQLLLLPRRRYMSKMFLLIFREEKLLESIVWNKQRNKLNYLPKKDLEEAQQLIYRRKMKFDMNE
jgi:hypothetical protein